MPRKSQDLSGFKPFRVLWIEPHHKMDNGNIYWRGQCDCGKEVFASVGNTKTIKSCGCITEEQKKYDENGNKWCYACKSFKPIQEFPSNKSKWDGLSSSCFPCSRTKSIKWRKDNPETAKSSDLKKSYGITLEERNKMLEDQFYLCAACSSPEPKGKYNEWNVDHNHATKKVRGLLCSPCNLTLGNAGESIERLESLVEYLKKHNL